jgi:hypothetical protein
MAAPGRPGCPCTAGLLLLLGLSMAGRTRPFSVYPKHTGAWCCAGRVYTAMRLEGAGGCGPPPPVLRATGVAGRRGGEARCARRAPQHSPGGKGVSGRRLRCGPRPCLVVLPGGVGFGLGGVGCSAQLEPGDARSQRGGGGGCARDLAVHKPPPDSRLRQNPPPMLAAVLAMPLWFYI